MAKANFQKAGGLLFSFVDRCNIQVSQFHNDLKTQD